MVAPCDLRRKLSLYRPGTGSHLAYGEKAELHSVGLMPVARSCVYSLTTNRTTCQLSSAISNLQYRHWDDAGLGPRAVIGDHEIELPGACEADSDSKSITECSTLRVCREANIQGDDR